MAASNRAAIDDHKQFYEEPWREWLWQTSVAFGLSEKWNSGTSVVNVNRAFRFFFFFFFFSELPAIHSIHCHRMIRFMKGNDDDNDGDIDEKWRWSFDFLSTLLALTQDNDGIELVMCQANERPEKHTAEMERRKICHLPSKWRSLHFF